MPKVDAYFGNGVVIPVASAIKGVAYLCPFTSTVHKTKRDYTSHLKRVRGDIHREIHRKNKQKIMETLWTQPTFEDIIAWFDSHQEFLFNNAVEKNGWRSKKVPVFDPTEYKARISRLELTYQNSCSNSHSAPHDGVTNWGGDVKLRDGTPAPRGYPGWFGNIEFIVESKHDLGGSDAFKGLRIHTGSGGSGNGVNYGYSVTFFDSDWPALTANLTEDANMSDLMDRLADRIPEKRKFSWGEPRYFKRSARN